MLRILTPVICILILLTQPLQADSDKTAKQKQLKQIKSRIEKLRKTIEVKENSKSSYTRQLRNIEKQIGQLGSKIRDSNRQIKQRQKTLNSLKKQKKQLQSTIQQQNQQLASQIHSAYTLGQQEHIKLLFSQSNASTLQRNLTYYQYFSRHRLNQIKIAQQNYVKLSDNEKQISATKSSLEQVLASQRQQKDNLTRDKSKRKNILSDLDKELKKQGRHLTQLQENARNLKQLIDSISEILTDIPTPPLSSKKFTSLRGKLAWPVKGKVRKLFGKAKPPSNLRWQGVIIQAPVGNNVRAISHGRIAFADWLRGMGNLIIIDHGQGYLSLYGHNQSLYKTAGEWVEAGDIIASIGSSGGQKKPGLYFEIRKKGKPQNPSGWCKASNWFAT